MAIDRPRALEFMRFCAVGTVGFLVDAGLLILAIQAGLDPIAGRFLSFAVAVVATFELNRCWAFRGGGGKSFLKAFAGYLGVQGLGFACNFGVYTLLYTGLPRPYKLPLLCLVVASALALIVNYAGASLWVFRTREPRHGE